MCLFTFVRGLFREWECLFSISVPSLLIPPLITRNFSNGHLAIKMLIEPQSHHHHCILNTACISFLMSLNSMKSKIIEKNILRYKLKSNSWKQLLVLSLITKNFLLKCEKNSQKNFNLRVIKFFKSKSQWKISKVSKLCVRKPVFHYFHLTASPPKHATVLFSCLATILRGAVIPWCSYRSAFQQPPAQHSFVNSFQERSIESILFHLQLKKHI